MKKRYISLFACTLLAVPAQAAVTAYDGFDYAAGALAGQSGGSGFSGAWTTEQGSGYTIESGSLAFSNLLTSGGRTEISAAGGWAASSRTARELSAPATGTFYGSYLFRRQSAVDNTTVHGLQFGPANIGDNNHSVQMYGQEYGQAVGTRAGGSLGSSVGSNVPQNQTFLVLFSRSITMGEQDLNLWVLGEDQFDTFKTGNLLTVDDLNAAGVGAASNQIWARSTFSGTDPAQTLSHLKMMSFGGGSAGGSTVSFDELRISNSSLDEATPLIPEPSSVLLGLVGFAALLRRRR